MFQKITKELKKNKVLKAGIGYTIGNYFLKGLGFITVPIFSRLMAVSTMVFIIHFCLMKECCT